jgi:hypothetical protein
LGGTDILVAPSGRPYCWCGFCLALFVHIDLFHRFALGKLAPLGRASKFFILFCSNRWKTS